MSKAIRTVKKGSTAREAKRKEKLELQAERRKSAMQPIKTRSQEARQRCIDTYNNDTVVRYVVTHIGRNGLRTLATPAQGRYTYETAEEAQQHVDGMMQHNSLDTLKSLFGLPLEVRPCRCWPGHFDPVAVYFDTGEPYCVKEGAP